MHACQGDHTNNRRRNTALKLVPARKRIRTPGARAHAADTACNKMRSWNVYENRAICKWFIYIVYVKHFNLPQSVAHALKIHVFILIVEPQCSDGNGWYTSCEKNSLSKLTVEFDQVMVHITWIFRSRASQVARLPTRSTILSTTDWLIHPISSHLTAVASWAKNNSMSAACRICRINLAQHVLTRARVSQCLVNTIKTNNVPLCRACTSFVAPACICRSGLNMAVCMSRCIACSIWWRRRARRDAASQRYTNVRTNGNKSDPAEHRASPHSAGGYLAVYEQLTMLSYMFIMLFGGVSVGFCSCKKGYLPVFPCNYTEWNLEHIDIVDEYLQTKTLMISFYGNTWAIIITSCWTRGCSGSW